MLKTFYLSPKPTFLDFFLKDETRGGAGGSDEDWSTVGGAGGGNTQSQVLKALWMELVGTLRVELVVVHKAELVGTLRVELVVVHKAELVGVLKMKQVPKALYPVCKLIASFLKLYDNVM